MKGCRFGAIVILLVAFAFTAFAESAEYSANFIRMTVEIDSAEVRLIRAAVYSGGVQQRRLAIEYRSDPYLMRLISNRGETLFEDTVQDPRNLFFDEPDLTGRLHGGMIRNKSGITTVVIPFFKNSRSVEFFHRVMGPEGDDAIQSQRLESLGSIAIGEIQASMRAQSALPAVAPVNIQKTGRPENRIDIVFLAEGYTAAQKASFLAVVRKVVANWKTLSPWSQYFRLLNVYAVPLVSMDSGADHPSRGSSKNTALDAAYDCAGNARLICISYAKAFAAATESVPDFDFAIAVVNDPDYGGSGGPVSVFSIHADAQQIFFHEFAHTFAKLADEYVAVNPNPGPFNEKLYANVTKINNRNTVKWKAWILLETPVPTPATLQDVIGIFQGAFFHPTKYFRPKADCMMRTLGAQFDSVCAEAHMLKAFEHVSFIDIPTPAATTLVLSGNASQPFKVKPVPLPLMRLQFEWFVDGKLQNSRVANFTLQGNQLTPGTHQVMVRITDKTSLVRTDPQKLRTDSFVWTVVMQ